MKCIWSVTRRNRRSKPPDERSTAKKARVANPRFATNSRTTRPSAEISRNNIAALPAPDLRPKNVQENEKAPAQLLRHARTATHTDRRKPSSRPACHGPRSCPGRENKRNRRSRTTHAHRAIRELKASLV